MTDTLLLHESSSTFVEAKAKGTYKVVLITPGRGSSGYYKEEMLKAFGPAAFPAKSHAYVDHIKADESRSPEKMIGVYPEGAYYEDGVGLVAELKPFSHYEQFVKEVAPYAGFSIFAQGTGAVEELDGEEVFMVEQLLPHVMNSVDLVAYAGRGGHLAESLLQEAMNKSTQREPSSGATDKEANMPTIEESAAALVSRVDVLVTAQEAAAATADAATDKATAVAEAIKSAVVAARAVAEAEVSEKVREKLYTQIESGNFDVEDALAEAVEIRKEIEAEVRESFKTSYTPQTILGSFASDAVTVTEDFTVGAWKH